MIFSITPDISVILPTFNRAAYIEEAIKSVIAQSYTNWELLVLDDGSSDNTFNVVNPFLTTYPNIRYLKHSNRKAALSRNAGIQASFGRYITFLDSDDQYTAEHLASRYKYMQEHKEIDIIVGGIMTHHDIYVRDCYNQDKMIHIDDCIVGPTLFGKKTAFLDLEGFKPLAYAGETELWERASSFLNIQKITGPKTYIYTPQEDSITSIIANKMKYN